jgi:succinate-acetate transporter protein
MGLFSLVCTLCALKVNVALVIVELFLTLTFALVGAAFFQSAQGGANAGSLQIVSH